jgi:peptide/nickel transport system permease protein
MVLYVLKRLVYAIPIALAVSAVCFSLVYLAPGDPASTLVPADSTPEVIARVKKDYGLDQPVPIQYMNWLKRAVTGDLGRSILTGRPVTQELGGAISNTFILALAAALTGFTLGILFGAIAGYHQGSWIDRVVTALSVTGVSVPHYWLGMLLVVVFSVILNWLPSMGAGTGGSKEWVWDWNHFRFIILPAITLSAIPTGIITRTVRALVADTLNREFVKALRAKGLMERAIFWHVVKNVAPTALAVMGLQLGSLLGGSILVETVFSWPGTGFLLNNAIFSRDIPILQGTILVLALFFVALNIIVDIVQPFVDPRIRRA